MMNTWQLRFAILWVLVNGFSNFCFAAAPPDGNPRTVYFTVGDTQDLFDFPPLDSRTSIAAAFETLQQQWQVERIWWRGGQDEVWGEEFIIRPENRQFAKIWDWWRDLQYRTIGTNRIAVDEAHRRGMKIWLTYGLFDNGSQADAGYVGFPYAVEDKLRVDHPEWAPANRWGTWRQGGPIEFAYPEARQAMADYLTKYVVEGKYDGISFLTYAENFSQRYEDEFGYSAPIVEEFRKKYGVDIRRDEFDRDAWRQMRGSHVTQFLRLLKKQLAAHGKQIAVCVHGQHPEKPMQWNVDGGVQTAGNFRWSLDDWLKGDVVDEINLFTPAAEPVIAQLMMKIREQHSPVRLTVFRSRGNLPPAVPRVMFLGREIESGYNSEHWIDYPDEVLTPEPIDSLASQDVYARRRLLTLALKAKQPLTPAQLSQAVSDPDIYVRRTALRTIAKHKVEGASAAVLKGLHDPENTVSCLAAIALGESNNLEEMQTLLVAAFDPRSTFQFNTRAVPQALKRFAATEPGGATLKKLLLPRLRDKSPKTRELTLYYYTLIGAPATPEVELALTEIALHDDGEYARELAVVNLTSSFGAVTSVAQTIRTVMQKDPAHAVQVRAATVFAAMHARLPAKDAGRNTALAEAVGFFRQYGDGCERTDRAWGWRLLGNSLLRFGQDGEAALKALLADGTNRELSDRAWRILYLKQGDQFFPVTEAEDAAVHKLHPWLK
jgi:HEAT repeats